MDKKMIYLLIILLCTSLALPGCQLARVLATRTSPTEITSAPNNQETTPSSTESSPAVTAGPPSPKPLFDFYTIPASWPRVVPIMSEFQVTLYERDDNSMRAQGYAKVETIRAINFYTNALKKHVSTNIWEQDPDKPSGNEEKTVFFNYIGEDSKLAVILEEEADGMIYFELIYTKDDAGSGQINNSEPASSQTSTDKASTSETSQPAGIEVDLEIYLIGSWMQVTESATEPRPVLIIFYDGTLDSNIATPGPQDNPQSWLGGNWQLGEPLEGSWESEADLLTVNFPEAEDSSFTSPVLALDEDNIQLEIAGQTVLYLRLPVS